MQFLVQGYHLLPRVRLRPDRLGDFFNSATGGPYEISDTSRTRKTPAPSKTRIVSFHKPPPESSSRSAVGGLPNSGKIGPSIADVGPTSADAGPNLVDSRPRFFELGRGRLNVADSGPELVDSKPKLVGIGRVRCAREGAHAVIQVSARSAGVGRFRTKVGRTWPNAVQNLAEGAPTWPTPAHRRSKLTDIGRRLGRRPRLRRKRGRRIGLPKTPCAWRHDKRSRVGKDSGRTQSCPLFHMCCTVPRKAPPETPPRSKLINPQKLTTPGEATANNNYSINTNLPPAHQPSEGGGGDLHDGGCERCTVHYEI